MFSKHTSSALFFACRGTNRCVGKQTQPCLEQNLLSERIELSRFFQAMVSKTIMSTNSIKKAFQIGRKGRDSNPRQHTVL